MCGIVGAIARRNIVPVLIEGLKRLEYRGYDSAGVAVLDGLAAGSRATLRRVRSTGRVAELEKLAGSQGLAGDIGIAHTRWATHGVPSEKNAHPHVSGGVSVVHNGIIENHDELRAKLRSKGYVFVSDTDSEVIAHLVHSHLKAEKTLFDAVRASVAELVGVYAIAVIDESDPARLVVARHSAPLLLGLGEGENFAASDTSALIQVTRRVIYLEDGDCAEITLEGARVTDFHGKAVSRPVHVSQLTADAVELGLYRHYMQKEIFEQPMAVANTLEMVTGAQSLSPQLFGAEAEDVLRQAEAVLILACGTSFHAGMVARYWLEGVAGIPTSVELALPDPRGTRDRRRFDQGLHHPACRAGAPHHGPREAPRQAPARARGASAPRAEASSPGPPARARARAASGEMGEEVRAAPPRAVPRPRNPLSDRDGRGAQAQGNLLHPRRSLRRGRIEARAARAGGPGHARGRDRPEGRALRETEIEPPGSAGAGRRAARVRRPGH